MEFFGNLKKLAQLIGGQGNKAVENANVALQTFDPETASEVEYEQFLKDLNAAALELGKLTDKAKAEDDDVVRVQGELEQKKQAARIIKGNLTKLQASDSAGEAVDQKLYADTSAAFDEALDKVEKGAAQLAQEEAEAQVAHETLAAYETFYRELSAKFKNSRKEFKDAKDDNALAQSRANLAEFRLNEEKKLAKMRDGVADGSSVATALRARTAALNAKTAAATTVTGTLKPDASSDILASAMAEARGGGKSQAERAAALL